MSTLHAATFVVFVVLGPVLRTATQLALLLLPLPPALARPLLALSRHVSVFYGLDVMLVAVPLLQQTVANMSDGMFTPKSFALCLDPKCFEIAVGTFGLEPRPKPATWHASGSRVIGRRSSERCSRAVLHFGTGTCHRQSDPTSSREWLPGSSGCAPARLRLPRRDRRSLLRLWLRGHADTPVRARPGNTPYARSRVG